MLTVEKGTYGDLGSYVMMEILTTLSNQLGWNEYRPTESRFFTTAGNVTITFIRDKDNRVTGLEMKLDGRISKAVKE